MCPGLSFEELCAKNLREILLNIFSGAGSNPDFSHLSMRSVTGPLTVDEDDNPNYGEVIATATLISGPLKKKVENRGAVRLGHLEYTFKASYSEESARKVAYHVFSLGNKVIGYDNAETLLARTTYFKVRVTITLPSSCNYRALYLNKKSYTKLFGPIDGASEKPPYDNCSIPSPTIGSSRFDSDDYLEDLMGILLSGSISSFFNKITIHDKVRFRCQHPCLSYYSSSNPGSCFDISDSKKKLVVTRNKAEKIALRCIYTATSPAPNLTQYNLLYKTEICRYIFSPVSGSSSKFKWAGLLTSNKMYYSVPLDLIYPYTLIINLEGKPIKIVVHFIFDNPLSSLLL